LNRLVNRRIRLLLAVLTCAFAGLLLRATWLQGVRAESLARLGQTQQRKQMTLPASRGTLYDRTGVELGLGESATTVFANPKQIANPRAAAVAVERTLGLDANQVYPELADRTRGFVYVERQADPAQAAALKRLKLSGFGFYPEERRAYPQGSVASQVLGYVGEKCRLRGLGRHLACFTLSCSLRRAGIAGPPPPPRAGVSGPRGAEPRLDAKGTACGRGYAWGRCSSTGSLSAARRGGGCAGGCAAHGSGRPSSWSR